MGFRGLGFGGTIAQVLMQKGWAKYVCNQQRRVSAERLVRRVWLESTVGKRPPFLVVWQHSAAYEE